MPLLTSSLLVLVCLPFGQEAGQSPVKAQNKPELLIGSWQLETDPGATFRFGSDGSFAFKAPAWNSTSSGRYESKEGKVWLTYSVVDGTKLTWARPLAINVEPDSFSIGKFRYVRKK